ncbi:MAG: methylenetetrahydrofolate reductase C-terminal domain-containing protein [Butyricicoccus sp.]|nr:methylenetetrahydrofolate reductase C-terminal domain-containing protein [Butyricicoccus sp.]
MLITKLKAREDILSMLPEKVFVIQCHGCKEISFPEAEADELTRELLDADRVTGVLTTDYICNTENLPLRLERRRAMIDEADAVLVLSCGVGVQTVSDMLDGKAVYAGCDTVRLPGFQGVTPLEYDCGQCGECYLSLTGGICPITACSKSLVNGQCGGARNGRCEVDQNMECGWERIYRRLEAVGRLDALRCPTQLRNFAVDANKSH